MKKIIPILILFFMSTAQAQVLITPKEGASALRRIPIFLADSASPNHLSGKTGIVTPTCYLTKNGGAAAVCSGTFVEINAVSLAGYYYYQATQSEVDTLGYLAVEISGSGFDNFHALAQVKEFISHGTK